MNNDNNNIDEKNNNYKDYLPQNRFKNDETSKVEDKIIFSKKTLKQGLFTFYGVVSIMIIGVVLHFNGIDILKPDERNYNMNLAEAINLEHVYKDSSVKWETRSNNVVVENNVIKAIKPGNAYLYAHKDGRQITDLELKVLNGREALAIASHMMQLNVGESCRIFVKSNSLAKNSTSFMKKSYVRWKRFLRHNVFNRKKYNNRKNGNGISNINNNNKDDNVDNNIDNNINSTDNNLDVGDNSISNANNNDVNYEDDKVDYFVQSFDEDVDALFVNDNNNYLEYVSSDESIAKVDDEGNIIPVSPGTVRIYVSDIEGNEDYSVVTIKDDDIELYRDNYEVSVGSKFSVDYDVVGNKYKENDVNLYSEDESIAKIDEDGNIVAVGVGKTNIIVGISNETKEDNNDDTIIDTDDESIDEEVDSNNSDVDESDSIVDEEEFDDEELSDDVSVVEPASNIVNSNKSAKLLSKKNNIIEKTISVNVISESMPKELILNSDTTMSVGAEFKATYSYDSVYNNCSISWKSNDTAIASVTDEGVVTGIKAGSAIVTATSCNGLEKSFKLTVTPVNIPVEELNISNISSNAFSISRGSKKVLEFTKKPENATVRSISISSSNTNIVSVNKDYSIVGNRMGKAIITVTTIDYNNVEFKKEYQVTVKEGTVGAGTAIAATSLSLAKSSAILYQAQKYNVRNMLNIEPKDATITATSSDTSVVKASGEIIEAVTTDSNTSKSATITVKTSNGKTVSFPLTVVKPLKLLGKISFASAFSIANAAINSSADFQTINVAEGFCIAENFYIFAKIEDKNYVKHNPYARIWVKNRLGKTQHSFTMTQYLLGHANDCTYNPNSKRVFFTLNKRYGNGDLAYIPFNQFKTSNKLESSGITPVSFPNSNSNYAAGGVTYDRSNSRYYVLYRSKDSNSMFVRVYKGNTIDTSYKDVKITKSVDQAPQGVGSYDGKVLVARNHHDGAVSLRMEYNGKMVTENNVRNGIDIYRVSKDGGVYLGTYLIDTGGARELETVDYDYVTNKVAAYFNYGWTETNQNLDHVMKLSITIPN